MNEALPNDAVPTVEIRNPHVENPAHYNMGKFEVIEVLKDWGLLSNFCLANVVKYIARAEHKGKTVQDLEKARWYLDYEIKRRKAKDIHARKQES